MRINDHSLPVYSQHSDVEAAWELSWKHFDVFNAMEGSRTKRERNRYAKGCTILSHAFDYLAANRIPQESGASSD